MNAAEFAANHDLLTTAADEIEQARDELDQAYGDIASIRDDKNKRIAEIKGANEQLRKINYNLTRDMIEQANKLAALQEDSDLPDTEMHDSNCATNQSNAFECDCAGNVQKCKFAKLCTEEPGGYSFEEHARDCDICVLALQEDKS